MNENKIDELFEWAVWGNLQSKIDLELIVLKGHLLIEIALETTLKRYGIKELDSFSFHKKILLLEKSISDDHKEKNFLINMLSQINRLRNKLAHNADFDINNSDLESWAIAINSNLIGRKWSKFTYKNKIIHAFSTLSINILNLTR